MGGVLFAFEEASSFWCANSTCIAASPYRPICYHTCMPCATAVCCLNCSVLYMYYHIDIVMVSDLACWLRVPQDTAADLEVFLLRGNLDVHPELLAECAAPRLFPISASLLIVYISRLFPDTYVLCGAYYAGMFNGEGIVNGINSPNLITFGTYVLAIQYCVSTDPPGRIRVRAGSLSARVSGDVSDMCTECMCACVPWVCDSDSKTHLTRSGTLSHLLLRRTATASVRQPPLMLWSYLRTCGLQYVVLIGSCQSLASLRSSVGCSEPCSTRSTKSSRYRHISTAYISHTEIMSQKHVEL
eukprot:COSAG06_NODE_838_length_12005_cov_473.630354_4_plen_300_part_00